MKYGVQKGRMWNEKGEERQVEDEDLKSSLLKESPLKRQ